MSMDKFGRTRRNNGAFGTNQQVLIPNNLLRTDGTNAMQANLDLSNNEIVNVGVCCLFVCLYRIQLTTLPRGSYNCTP